MRKISSQQLISSMETTYNQAIEIAKKKNHDYTQASDNALKNFELVEYLELATTEVGMMSRILDKISRLATLVNHEAKVKDESMQDSIIDMINYLAILKATIDNR